MNKKTSAFLLASAIVSTNSNASIVFEDDFDWGPKINATREFADGLSGGAISKMDKKAKELGNKTRKALDKWGYKQSEGARKRMEKNTGVKDTTRERQKIYKRVGSVV